jgi:hypothetical protein
MPKPHVSLVICTRNRGARLRRALASLAQLQCERPWELIVVDNGSSDDTSRILQEFRGSFHGSVRILGEATPGLANARNRGWRAALAPVVAFTDDDCYPDARFLECILGHFDADEELGFLGGRILLYDDEDFPITVLETCEPIDFAPRCIIPAGLVQGANMALRRSALSVVGGFDEQLGAGTPFPSEDIDVVARVSALGWKGAYRPDVLVYHHHGRKSSQEVGELMRSYDRGRGAYYAKCLLNRPIRRSALRHWARCLRYQPLQKSRREVAAGIAFAVRQYTRRPSRPAPSARLEE